MTCHSKGPGTYPYMAPEMFQKIHRGPAVEIYSFGYLYTKMGNIIMSQLGLFGSGEEEDEALAVHVPENPPRCLPAATSCQAESSGPGLQTPQDMQEQVVRLLN